MYIFYKSRILNQTMKFFGEVSGEVTFSFHMDLYTVEVFVFYWTPR